MIVFDMYGVCAHFRKFYTNSSSLSYSIPPRTVVAGFIAAILGYARDSYYELFSCNKLDIAVRKMSKTRKIMQSLNYIRATTTTELVCPREHTQIPFEIVVGDEGVKYRIYVKHESEEIMDRLYESLKTKASVYPPYFGAAPFNADFALVGVFDLEERYGNGNFLKTATVIDQNYIMDKGLKLEPGISLFKDRMPKDFGTGREIKETASYIYDENLNPLNVKVAGNYFIIRETGENILFM
ncbi:MAG: type I-B CRISPR-associated protein Cas5 [Firmicutes bacterium]|nr:type I-B CRISPR-associated protein Cas5 [Bacillota bacterium]